MLVIATRLTQALARHAYTLFLFTKSDIKTTVIPVTFFAVAATPRLDLWRIHQATFWIWLHVLQFDVSNQTLDPEEDEMNKRDRPLPSKRLTLQQAIALRWVLVPVCWLWSLWYSVETFWASVALVTLTIIYDEMGAHRGNFVVRNVVNAAGFASFEVGSTLVATDTCRNLDWAAILSVFLSAGIFATTIHAQDFKDVYGDKMVGRMTIPIVMPRIARYTVIIPMSLWSLSLVYIWGVDWATATVFLGICLLVGIRFLRLTGVHDDQVSFYWYNVWLSFAHALPGYYRLYSASAF